jgi:hypothetical protein
MNIPHFVWDIKYIIYKGYFHLFVNSVAVNIGVQISVWYSQFFACIRVELLDHIVNLCSGFWGMAIYFPQWLHHFIFLPALTGESQFLHILINTCCFHLLLMYYFLVIAILWVWSGFSLWFWCVHPCWHAILLCIFSFLGLVCHLYLFLRNYSSSFAYFLIGLIAFLCWVVRVFFIFWKRDPYQVYDLQNNQRVLK